MDYYHTSLNLLSLGTDLSVDVLILDRLNFVANVCVYIHLIDVRKVFVCSNLIVNEFVLVYYLIPKEV